MNRFFTFFFIMTFAFSPCVSSASSLCRIQERALKAAHKQLTSAERKIDQSIRKYNRAVFALERSDARAAQKIDRLEAKRVKTLLDVGLWAAQCTLFDQRACRKWSRMLQRVVKMEQQIGLQHARADRAFALSLRKIDQAEQQILFVEQSLPNYQFDVFEAEDALQRCLAGS
jgi:hypothetical protein